MNDKKEDRLYDWAMMSVFSAIVLGSMVDSVSNPNSRQKWMGSCAVVTMAIGAIVSIFYKVKADLIGGRIEGVLAGLVLVLWIVNLPFYRGDVFVNDLLSSLIANIYYFSWAALFTCFRLCARLLTAEVECTEQVKKRINHWVMLLALNLVVMVTSSYDYTNRNEGMDDKLRRLTLLALIVGIISSFESLTAAFLLTTTFLEKWQSKIECLKALVNTALYAVTIGFINATDGPGGRIGNMYYFMWFSFLKSTMLALECCNDLCNEWTGTESAEKEKDAGTVGDEEHPQEQEKEAQQAEAQDENVAENV